MKNLLLFLSFLLLAASTDAQVTAKITADSVRMYQTGLGSAELILENATRARTGAFLRNKGNGRTEFGYAVDSIWADGPLLKFRLGSTTTALNIYAQVGIADITGLQDSLNQRALLSQVPTNNNQLTNGAGYLTTIDSTTFATRAYAKKVGDSTYARVLSLGYATTGQLALKVNVSDTTSMLSPYRSAINSNTSNISANTTALASKVGSTTDNNLKITGTTIATNKAFQTLTDGPTVTWNVANGITATVTIAGTRTLSITNAQAGDVITLKVIQDATGSRDIIVPSNSKGSNGLGLATNQTVDLSNLGGAIDLLIGLYDGTTFLWIIVKNFT